MIPNWLKKPKKFIKAVDIFIHCILPYLEKNRRCSDRQRHLLVNRGDAQVLSRELKYFDFFFYLQQIFKCEKIRSKHIMRIVKTKMS